MAGVTGKMEFRDVSVVTRLNDGWGPRISGEERQDRNKLIGIVATMRACRKALRRILIKLQSPL